MALLLGFAGVLGFSFTLPATRLAVADLDATFVGIATVVAAVVVLASVAATQRTRVTLPERQERVLASGT